MKPQRNVLCLQQAFSSITNGYKTPIAAMRPVIESQPYGSQHLSRFWCLALIFYSLVSDNKTRIQYHPYDMNQNSQSCYECLSSEPSKHVPRAYYPFNELVPTPTFNLITNGFQTPIAAMRQVTDSQPCG